jgi:hypothetical protein
LLLALLPCHDGAQLGFGVDDEFSAHVTVAFDEVVEKVADAGRQVEADGGASPVLVAVVREFQAKLVKAEMNATDGVPGRDSVMELEQAGDSAKAAAEADVGLSSDSRESVLAAHLAICKLKAGA